MIKLLKSMSVQKSFPIPNFIMGLAVWASIFDGSSRNKKMLAKNVLESDVLSLELAWLLSRYWDFGREIALGILAFWLPTILEAPKAASKHGSWADPFGSNNKMFVWELFY